MVKFGRPLKFKSIDEFESKAKEYFESIGIEKWTVTGLALHLETTRETLDDYASGKYDKHFSKDVDFSDSIKRAKQYIQHSYELSNREKGRAGDIFGLKNFGWKDKQEQDINIKGELDVGGAFNKIKK